jgi:hypothetical protein
MGHEVFMSLPTTIRTKALTLSHHLFALFQVLLKVPEMDFRELRRKLNEHPFGTGKGLSPS